MSLFEKLTNVVKVPFVAKNFKGLALQKILEQENRSHHENM
jgi:hypothetical protein